MFDPNEPLFQENISFSMTNANNSNNTNTVSYQFGKNPNEHRTQNSLSFMPSNESLRLFDNGSNTSSSAGSLRNTISQDSLYDTTLSSFENLSLSLSVNSNNNNSSNNSNNNNNNIKNNNSHNNNDILLPNGVTSMSASSTNSLSLADIGSSTLRKHSHLRQHSHQISSISTSSFIEENLNKHHHHHSQSLSASIGVPLHRKQSTLFQVDEPSMYNPVTSNNNNCSNVSTNSNSSNNSSFPAITNSMMILMNNENTFYANNNSRHSRNSSMNNITATNDLYTPYNTNNNNNFNKSNTNNQFDIIKNEVNNKKKRFNEKELYSKYKDFTFVMLEPIIYELSIDQNGCRFLQRKLDNDKTTDSDIISIYNQVKPKFYKLVINSFGNYFIQKVWKFFNVDQRLNLLTICGSNLSEIAINQHGTRVLQKMIELISTPEEIQIIINGLSNNVIMLIKDLNGNHVIQKCLTVFDSQFIIDSICTNIVTVATHRHGCCVLQKTLDNCTEKQFMELSLIILDNCLILSQDPFGNYVIQYLIPKNYKKLNPNFAEIVGEKITNHLSELSIQKFSSNVVEKCLNYINNNKVLRNKLVKEILTFNNLEVVLKDSYGNYVVQTALELANLDPTLKKLAIEKITNLTPLISTTPYEKKIQQRLNELLS